ncbi:nuclear transport factor 2 family protein [Microbacterium sp. F2]|uniref:nuclear transport factor 2 family protein n=1 Tax=Microbacterium sp. F2 TaxID=3422228 RepID=UPI003FD54210
MSESLGGLPSVLTAYFSAINAGDISGAVEFVSPDATVSIRDAGYGGFEGSGRGAFEAWLAEAMTTGRVTVVPLASERSNDNVRVELAVSVFRPAYGAVTMLQQIDYTIDHDWITAASGPGIRHVRWPAATTQTLDDDSPRDE